MSWYYTPKPTVVPVEGFDASADANALRAAMKGFGTDEQAIIDILCARSADQRTQILETYASELGRDLIEDLKSELGGKFEDVIVALMMPADKFLCKQLRKAMDGIGTNEDALIEILAPQTNEEIKRIVDCYEEMYNRPLAEHLCSETDGSFRRLLTMIIVGSRDPQGTVDADLAVEQATALFEAGEGQLGTDEKTFYSILAHASFDQLELVFEEYKKLSGRTIEQALKDELSGELYDALSAIVECVQMAPHYFAKRLHKAMDGAGTDDGSLIRIIVARSEIDLQNIKDEFEQMYNKTLISAVRGETSGDYKRALCALIGEA
ncbi:annexin x [Culex quinquefasciatus]|uniref:Annexin n=1 Tax=Culex quinquefasciatus TaxID=7176 RepID=B0WMU8_CULQU|nr:annexin B10 [Culex quinquefasciatus]EDS31340.1 annexin x [Culex quinquefasciatus]|eukprot:XP_001850032.1 annexin x [Culex quinquefasciatus]